LQQKHSLNPTTLRFHYDPDWRDWIGQAAYSHRISNRIDKTMRENRKDKNMITISVIIGSTREGRFSEKPARWILQHLQKREGIEARLLDLREFPMPFFEQPLPPAMPGRPPYEHDVVKRWTAAIGASDGFIFVTPEYNYGPSAVLKNAIDWVYPEWNRKAAAFVGYGSAMGARSVQQLRETAIEIQMAPVRSSVHIPVATLWAHFQGGDVDKGLAELEKQAQTMIDDLLWWATALKTARQA
jgi:NAD(P)H-dependent FMN reductase